jgi:hypothetical protein
MTVFHLTFESVLNKEQVLLLVVVEERLHLVTFLQYTVLRGVSCLYSIFLKEKMVERGCVQ